MHFTLLTFLQNFHEEQNELVAICDQFQKLKHSYQNAYVFTEHRVTMLAGILNSDKAVEINVQVV